jgi:Mpv17 / PMP22 family
LACARSQQAWPLLQLQSAKNGSIWRTDQCSAWAHAYQYAAETFRQSDESQGQDPPNPPKQSNRKSDLPSEDHPLDIRQIAPIQNTVYLASMAVIAGARTWHQVRATVRAGFMPVMKVSWITSPLALAFAQKFLPEQTWVPFFNIVAFIIGTYINTHTKKKRLAALRKKVWTLL